MWGTRRRLHMSDTVARARSGKARGELWFRTQTVRYAQTNLSATPLLSVLLRPARPGKDERISARPTHQGHPRRGVEVLRGARRPRSPQAVTICWLPCPLRRLLRVRQLPLRSEGCCCFPQQRRGLWGRFERHYGSRTWFGEMNGPWLPLSDPHRKKPPARTATHGSFPAAAAPWSPGPLRARWPPVLARGRRALAGRRQWRHPRCGR